MKNKEILDLHAGIIACDKLKGIKFTYALVKNRKKLEIEIAAQRETLEKNNPDYNEFKTKQKALSDEFGTKTIQNGMAMYKFENEDDRKKYVDALKALKTEYKEVIEQYEKQEKELLEAETNIELHKIKIADVPKEIEAGQLNGIRDLIIE